MTNELLKNLLQGHEHQRFAARRLQPEQLTSGFLECRSVVIHPLTLGLGGYPQVFTVLFTPTVNRLWS